MRVGMSIDDHVRALVELGRIGDAAAEVVRGLGPEVLRYLRRLLRNDADAADAFSHFAESVWRGLGAFRFRCSVRAWAYRVAGNAVRDQRKQPWHQRRRRLWTREAQALAAEIRTRTRERVERQRRSIDVLLRSLPERDQELLFLRIDAELTWPEIAAAISRTGSPLDGAAAMKRYQRLSARLARMARERGILG